MKPAFQAMLRVALLGALAAGGALARAQADLPPVQQADGIEYLSGGIGADEARAFEQASRQWPLTLEFAVQAQPRAEYAAGVQVLVRDQRGRSLLQTRSDGPFLLLRLAPGRYHLEATLAGRTLRHTAVLRAGQPAKAVFVWPAGTGDAGP